VCAIARYVFTVRLLPESPKRRRRLRWLALGALVASSAAVTIVLLPKDRPIAEQASNQPAQVAESRQAHLSTTDRVRINATVDRFLVAALDRRDPATAWALAGPDLRGSSTAADWAAGNMPLPRYPARGRHFRGWTQVDVGRNSVSFNLLVQPRASSKAGAMALSIQVVRRARSWAVNRAYPAATFTAVGEKPRVVGPNDFGALGRGEAATSKGTLSRKWFAVPVALFVLGLLGVALVVSRNWLRYRRARRAFAPTDAKAMPSLPRSYRDEASSRLPDRR
jgi:hypothetical protein